MLSAEFYEICETYWAYIVKNLSGDGYITGVVVFNVIGKPDGIVKMQPNIKITPKGLQYLAENSVFQKVCEVIKDFSGLIP
jgi:hypothetical protein